jgi:membrane protein
MKLKDALIGLSFTSIFFMIGKFAIGFICSSTVATVYGAADHYIILVSILPTYFIFRCRVY